PYSGDGSPYSANPHFETTRYRLPGRNSFCSKTTRAPFEDRTICVARHSNIGSLFSNLRRFDDPGHSVPSLSQNSRSRPLLCRRVQLAPEVVIEFVLGAHLR